MSDLLNTVAGRKAVIQAQRYILRRRLSRFFKRNGVIAFDEWESGSQDGLFSQLPTILGSLNVDHDSELEDIYRMLGVVGGFEYSVADCNIYVDGTDGSDTEGDGSTDNPYQSVWFLDLLPRKIRHAFRIIIRNDVEVTGDTDTVTACFDFTFSDGGFLTVVGEGAPSYSSDDLTVSSVTSWPATPGLTGIVAASGVINSYANSFLKVTDSATFENNAYNLWWCSSNWNSIVCPASILSSLLANDTVRVCLPTPSLSAFNFYINVDGPIQSADGDRSKVTFANLNVISSGDTDSCGVEIVDSDLLLSFCTVKSNGTMHIKGSDINQYDSADTSVLSVSQCTIENVGEKEVGFVHIDSNYLSLYGRCKVSYFSSDNLVYIYYVSNVLMSHAGTAGVLAYSSNVYLTMVGTSGSSGGAAVTLNDCVGKLDNIALVDGPTYPVSLVSSRAQLTNITQPPATISAMNYIFTVHISGNRLSDFSGENLEVGSSTNGWYSDMSGAGTWVVGTYGTDTFGSGFLVN